MQNVYVFPALAALLCGGCMTTSVADHSGPQTESIMIHSKDGKLFAQVGRTKLEVHDCSDAILRCIQVHNAFAFVYPRKCPYGGRYHDLRWKQNGIETFLSTPYPDLALPAGVYMSTLSDKVSYDYDTKNGLTRIIVARHPISSNNYNRGQYEHSYRVAFQVKYLNNFICD
jgi:hypothetical protein